MGVVTGEMLVDGRQRDVSFQRKTGYVQQQDLHLETSTVREALRFSAILRQSKNVPMKEKLEYVEEVLKLLEMDSYADAVVGVPGEGTLSCRIREDIADIQVSTSNSESDSLSVSNWSPSPPFCSSSTNLLPDWTLRPRGTFFNYSENSLNTVKLSCVLSINLPPCCLSNSTDYSSSPRVVGPSTLVKSVKDPRS